MLGSNTVSVHKKMLEPGTMIYTRKVISLLVKAERKCIYCFPYLHFTFCKQKIPPAVGEKGALLTVQQLLDLHSDSTD